MLSFQVCNNLYHDMVTAINRLNFDDVCVDKFQARCMGPPLTWEEISQIRQPELPRVIFGSHCVSELAAQANLNKSIQLIHRRQCFYFFCPKTLVDSLQHQGAYLLTPGWLTNWTGHMDQWGFDRNTAIEFFKESTKKLVLLDTGTNEKNLDELIEFAGFINKPYEVIPIGLEYHEMLLARQRADYLCQQALNNKQNAERLAADHALVQDILRLLPEAVEERNVVNAARDLITALMAPDSTIYIPVKKSRPQFESVKALPSDDIQIINTFYSDETKEYFLTANDNFLFLKIRGSKEVVGIVIVRHLAFPEHMPHYLNIILNITGIFGLAIEHVRTIERLMHASIVAGKAELAAEMLHNVGNVLNSVSVSSEQIKQILSTASATKIGAVSKLFQTHSNDLKTFFSEDPRGKKMPLYLKKLSEKIDLEQGQLIQEADFQFEKIKIIADIIRTQQDFSGNSSIRTQVDLVSLLEESIEVYSPQIKGYGIKIIKKYKIMPTLKSQRSKLLQIILNLMGNCVDALKDSDKNPKQINVKITQKSQGMVTVEMTDNGNGIDPDVLPKIFIYGFSTKKNGHGFGLHNAANLATQLSGTLTASSKGKDCGSSFILTLPLKNTDKKHTESILISRAEDV